MQRRAQRPAEDLEAVRGLAHGWTLEADLGVLSWLTLAAAVPFVYKTQEATLGAGTVQRDAGGPGDPLLLVRVTVLGHRAAAPEAPRLTLLGGVKLPLGSYGARDEHGPLPPGLEPGTGAADLVTGLGFTFGPARRTLLLASAVYRHPTTSAAGYRLGDTLEAAASARLTYLWPVALSAGLRLGWSAPDRQDGETVHASGGLQLLGQLGAAYYPRRGPYFAVEARAALWQALRHSPLATVVTFVGSTGYTF